MISLRAGRRDIAAGARAMAPWLTGVVPFGLVIGVSGCLAGDSAVVPGLPVGKYVGEPAERLPRLGVWRRERHWV